jgi:hypothetical protein
MGVRFGLIVLVLLAGHAQAADPVAFARDPELARIAKDLAAARKAAVDFLFDNARYPETAKARRGWRVGIDVQPGHGDMGRRVCAAICKHNEAVEVVAKLLLARTRVVGTKRATRAPLKITRAVNHYGVVVIDTGVEKFLKAYKKRYDAWRKAEPESNNRLAHAMGALAYKDWKAARTLGGPLKGGEELVWETVRPSAPRPCSLGTNASVGGTTRTSAAVSACSTPTAYPLACRRSYWTSASTTWRATSRSRWRRAGSSAISIRPTRRAGRCAGARPARATAGAWRRT